MLIGNDYHFDLFLQRQVELEGSLVQSKLGWILGGRYQVTSDTTNAPNLMVSTAAMAPTAVKVTTHILSAIEVSLLTGDNLDQF